jgi:hypothetical protein
MKGHRGSANDAYQAKAEPGTYQRQELHELEQLRQTGERIDHATEQQRLGEARDRQHQVA